MENVLKLFTQLNDKAYATANRFFGNKARAAMLARWQDYCANGTQRIFAHGDIKVANKMYAAATNCGFMLAFIRAVVPQIPFKFDKVEGFTGKIFGAKRDALLALNEDGIQKWEADMRFRFDNENEKSNKTPDYLKRFNTALSAALKHDVDAKVLRDALNAGIKANLKVVATGPTGDAQALIKAAKAA